MFVQCDDSSGEVVGHALDELLELGARNVQMLSSHTKKGRPGMVLLLDLDARLESEVATYLAAELGIWGYHVLETKHRHFDVAVETRCVTLRCGSGQRSRDVRCKLFRHGGRLLRVKLEHDDALRLLALARDLDSVCSLEELRAAVERIVRQQPHDHEFEVSV